MTIPSVIQGLVETEGKVFELDSPKGVAWLESIGSFRFEPGGNSKACTVRREPSGYWYGCRKVAGKVRKKYIGKSSEVTVAKLKEIAEALEIPPVPKAGKVAEVTQRVTQEVAEVAQDRLTALELQVANLQKAVEALQEVLPGKLDAGDSLELPKVDNEVVEGLQDELSNPSNELSNLKTENQKIRADYAALLESSTHVTNKLREEVRELRSELTVANREIENLENQLTELFEPTPQDAKIENLKSEIERLKSELADRSQTPAENSVAASKNLPEAADLLNQLKAKRKKSKADLGDVGAILEMIEKFCDDTSQN